MPHQPDAPDMQAGRAVKTAPARRRILVISNAIVKADYSAGDRRFFALIEMLARHHDVDFCSTLDEFAEGRAPGPDLIRYRAMLEATGARVIEARWRSVPTALAQHRYDLALCEFYHVAAKYIPFLRASQPGIKIVIDSVDTHFTREFAAAALGEGDAAQAAQTKVRELRAYRAADAVIAITTLDRDVLTQEGGMPPLYVLPIIMATRARESGQVCPRGRECLFIGGFLHTPNLDGLRWFCREIWPRVRERVADAALTVIGSSAPPEVEAFGELPGVRVLGFVPDTAPSLDRAAVSIAPLRYGAGMKGKVTEAMAWGLPVVTTSVGAQGLEVVSGRELCLADTPEAFAQNVVDLLLDPERAEQLGLAGQKYIAGVCSPGVVEAGLFQMLADLLPDAPAEGRAQGALRWQAAALGFKALTALMSARKRRGSAQAL